jgi:hypothetical protein
MTRIFRAFLALALLLTAPLPVLGQSMQFSNPVNVSGKANLAGGNTFTGGDQDILGYRLHLQDNPVTANWYLYAGNGSGNLNLYSDQSKPIVFYSGGAQTGQIDANGFALASGIVLKSNTTTVINGSGVLQAAAFPALTGDVTTSAGALATTIANNAVSYAKFQQPAANSIVANPTGSTANAQSVTLAGGLGFSGTTLTINGAVSSPTSVTSSGAILSSGATSGVGYTTGAGGTVTQITSRTTGVTLNKACGGITLVSAAGSATWRAFTVTDSAVAATDVVVVNQKSGTDKYMISVTNVGSGTFEISSATTGGTTTEQPVLNFCVVKGVSS